MLKLYYFHGATCGLKARLTLAEKDVEYTHEVVDRSYLRTPDYKKLNPNAVVPTLIHGPNVLIESSVIMNYVDDAFDGPELKPDLPINRAQMAMWLKNADEVYLPSLGTLTYTVSMRHKILEKSEAERKEYLRGYQSWPPGNAGVWLWSWGLSHQVSPQPYLSWTACWTTWSLLWVNMSG